jgi:hypothetical protein
MRVLISIFKEFFRHAGNMPLAMMCDRIQSGFYANVITPLREAIAQGDLELAERLKKALPAFTLSATYNGRRKDDCIVNYNGLIMLDIDKQEPETIDDLAAKAAELEGTVFTFRSPSGNGLKIGVRPKTMGYGENISSPQTPNAKPQTPYITWALTLDRHRDTFNFVKEVYESALGVVIDPSGKDAGRLCFVSYDPCLKFFPQRLEGFEMGYGVQGTGKKKKFSPPPTLNYRRKPNNPILQKIPPDRRPWKRQGFF